MSSVISLPLNDVAPAAEGKIRRSIRPQHVVLGMMVVAAVALFICSSARHFVLRSGAFDLGFFDQAVYLISRGETPISSLHGFHVLADHASLILYPLSLVYWIWSNPHMLLAVQAIALASGAWPVWRLARHAGLADGQALAVAGAYLMYPLVLTSNLFDFHPDVFAVPALLMAILAAREDRRIAFCGWVLLVLACKEVLALTVAAMGVWLWLAERRRFAGIFAAVAGAAWFVIAIKVLIPYFGAGRDPSGLEYYAYLGGSMGQILLNFVLHPTLALSRIFSVDSAKCLVIVAIPLLWGLHWRTLAPLLAVVPAVLLNLLSELDSQRSPFYHYSLPVVPFMFAAVILALATHRSWLRNGRLIIAWSVAMLALGFVARIDKLRSGSGLDWAAMQHTREAIDRIDSHARVLTTFETVPHLSHREMVQYVGGVGPERLLENYDYVLLSTGHASIDSTDPGVSSMLTRVAISPLFHVEYKSGDVYLFKRLNGAASFMPVAQVD